ncbi:hypothetical protein RRG08_018694 [Elysia crispata]|uniref:Uncharacterized protein n=1 Tax=Elysia crispata TaxID=231223 RepID=A0AAE0YF79_9GAST|nr:hypothetical protein RRG08_018694 [Elysia crispata]
MNIEAESGTDKVVVAHIQKLLNFSAKPTFWEIYDQAQEHVWSLANLNVTGQNYSLVLAGSFLTICHTECLSNKHTAKTCQKTCYFCTGFHSIILQRQQKLAPSGSRTHCKPDTHLLNSSSLDAYYSKSGAQGRYRSTLVQLHVHGSLLYESEFCFDISLDLDRYHELMVHSSVQAGNGMVNQETRLRLMIFGSYLCIGFASSSNESSEIIIKK